MTGDRREERVVPVYAFTRGRTRPAGQDLPLEAVVTTTERASRSAASLQMELRDIVGMCSGPMSLAEIGAALEVPVGVARVLVGDLANAGYLAVHLPQPAADGGPGHAILGRLLDGLRAR
jgi:Protein of unknown function (DUF742)